MPAPRRAATTGSIRPGIGGAQYPPAQRQTAGSPVVAALSDPDQHVVFRVVDVAGMRWRGRRELAGITRWLEQIHIPELPGRRYLGKADWEGASVSEQDDAAGFAGLPRLPAEESTEAALDDLREERTSAQAARADLEQIVPLFGDDGALVSGATWDPAVSEQVAVANAETIAEIHAKVDRAKALHEPAESSNESGLTGEEVMDDTTDLQEFTDKLALVVAELYGEAAAGRVRRGEITDVERAQVTEALRQWRRRTLDPRPQLDELIDQSIQDPWERSRGNLD